MLTVQLRTGLALGVTCTSASFTVLNGAAGIYDRSRLYTGYMPKRPLKSGTKASRVNYSPRRVVKALTVHNAGVAAREPEILLHAQRKKEATRLHIKGKSHEYISEKLGITTQEAHALITERIQEWVKSESFSPAEMREIVARRYDGPLALALREAMPHPAIDQFGRSMYGNICDCKFEIPQLCSLPDHTAQIITKPELSWLKVYLEILGEQKKMYGLDAANRLEQEKVDMLKRVYEGVDQKTLDEL